MGILLLLLLGLTLAGCQSTEPENPVTNAIVAVVAIVIIVASLRWASRQNKSAGNTGQKNS